MDIVFFVGVFIVFCCIITLITIYFDYKKQETYTSQELKEHLNQKAASLREKYEIPSYVHDIHSASDKIIVSTLNVLPVELEDSGFAQYLLMEAGYRDLL